MTSIEIQTEFIDELLSLPAGKVAHLEAMLDDSHGFQAEAGPEFCDAVHYAARVRGV